MQELAVGVEEGRKASNERRSYLIGAESDWADDRHGGNAAEVDSDAAT